MSENSLFGVVNTKITRRSFVKWSAAIGATASASGLVVNSALKSAGAVPTTTSVAPVTGGEVVEWVPTHCLMCHSWCGLAVGLDAEGTICKIEGQGGQPATAASRVDGSDVELAAGVVHGYGLRYDPAATTNATSASKSLWGNPDDADRFPAVADGFLPYHLNNKGRICAKGNNGMQHVYDPDRVKYPLIRRGARGAGLWKKISWREAYWKIACVIRELNGYTTSPSGTAMSTAYHGYDGITVAGTINNSATARGLDRRHRYVYYVGRNETEDSAGGNFKFGSPNRIEHTSLCESSRHQSTLTLFGHHFPFPDLNSHSGSRQESSNSDSSADFLLEIGGNPCEAKIPHSSYATRWGDRRRRAARIVVVDVRQSNSAAFADEWVAITPGTDGALVMGILGEIFKQVGSATLQSELLNGQLGGTAGDMTTRRWAGIFKSEIGGAAFTASKLGSNGIGNANMSFAAGSNAIPGTHVTDSLESELERLFGTNMGTTDPTTWAAGLTGVSAGTVAYLAGAMGGADLSSGSPVWSGTPTYNNPQVDGYRGPSKHTNGTYSYRAMRALQVICGRFEADANGIFDEGSGTWARGGIGRPGGLTVAGWGSNTAGYVNDYSVAAIMGGGGTGYSTISLASGVTSVGALLPVHTYPYASNKWNSAHDSVTIDRWDYDQGRTKFGIGTQGVDPNVIPGIRASLGLHPYKVGATCSPRRTAGGTGTHILPYGFRQTAYIASASVSGTYTVYCGPHAGLANLSGGAATLYQSSGSTAVGSVSAVNTTTGAVTLTGDPGAVAIGDHLVVDLLDANIPDEDYAVEALLIFKNAPGNTRANVKLAQELATHNDGTNYTLRHIWSIDTFMGDFTRFADIVLPDTTYLERWDRKDWEVIGLKGHWMMRQPVMRADMSKAIYDDDAKELFLYESRPVNSIAVELCRAMSGILYDTAGQGMSGYVGGAIYNACSGDEDYDPTVSGATPNNAVTPWDKLSLGGHGLFKQHYRNRASGSSALFPSISGVPAAVNGKWAFMRIFGNIYDSNQVINETTGYDGDFYGHGGNAKQNAPRTWLNDDLGTILDAGLTAASWADTGLASTPNRFEALEVFNKRMTQVLEPGSSTSDSSGTGAVGSTGSASINETGYNFVGVPAYQRSLEVTDATYSLHLTTYKVNVHTQSRTASLPRQMEIVGNNWAVMSVDTAAAQGVTNGDTVRVETAQGWVELEAMVTDRVANNVVAISAHFGHEARGQNYRNIGAGGGDGTFVTTVYGDSSAFGTYSVDTNTSSSSTSASTSYDDNRDDTDSIRGESTYTNLLDGAGGTDYSIGTASAPGAGVHPNHAINRTVGHQATSMALASDPVGTSMGWFDSKCKITVIS